MPFEEKANSSAEIDPLVSQTWEGTIYVAEFGRIRLAVITTFAELSRLCSLSQMCAFYCFCWMYRT